jgi:hypothetical protein
MEVKLEEFAVNYQEILKQIACLCGLDNTYQALPNISITKVNHWKDECSSNELDILNKELGQYIKKLGYNL